MHASGIKLLNLMFKPGEKVCVSDNQAGYHCIPLEEVLSGSVTLVHPNPEKKPRKVSTDKLILVALNPMKGFCRDSDCASFRNFLIEMDIASIDYQYEYIKKIGVPISACVFSGNKSLHFLITLEEDLPDEKSYRKVSEWLLGAITLADQATKNPSRKIRIPGAIRNTGKTQELRELRGPVKIADLAAWLYRHPDARPKIEHRLPISSEIDFERLPEWTKDRLALGLEVNMGRNAQWFRIACSLVLANYNECDTIEALAQFFTPQKDFTRKEWETTIKSAFSYIHRNRK